MKSAKIILIAVTILVHFDHQESAIRHQKNAFAASNISIPLVVSSGNINQASTNEIDPQKGNAENRKILPKSLTELLNFTSPLPTPSREFYRKYETNHSGIEGLKNLLGNKVQNRARTTQSSSNMLENMKKANKHILLMARKGKCSKPSARVINIQKILPDVRKEYLPKCTILYRCDSHSGCCDSDKYQCVANEKQYVRLYFYTITVKIDDQTKIPARESKMESFLFENHTKCRCEDAYDIPRIGSVYLQTSSVFTSVTQLLPISAVNIGPEIRKTTTPVTTTEIPTTTTTTTTTTPTPPKIKCRYCPLPFAKRISKHGGCFCDCFDRQRACIKIKRGKLFLAESERRCVEAKYCHEPECDYGNYMTTHGRCPKRSERRNRRRKHSLQHSKYSSKHRD